MGVVARVCLVIFGLCLAAGIGAAFVPSSSPTTGIGCGSWINPDFDDSGVDYDSMSLRELTDARDQILFVAAECEDARSTWLLVSVAAWVAALLVPGLIFFVAGGRRSDQST